MVKNIIENWILAVYCRLLPWPGPWKGVLPPGPGKGYPYLDMERGYSLPGKWVPPPRSGKGGTPPILTWDLDRKVPPTGTA